MNILKGVSLRLYSTMRLGGNAEYMVEVTSPSEMQEAAEWALEKNLPIIIVGHGSNIVWRDEGFKGLVIVNRIKGFNKISEDPSSVTYEIGSGEDWDKTVERLVSKGLSGVESLSLIPGTAGATPVQNVGAYGQEISSVLIKVSAYDTKERRVVSLNNKDCQFGYRMSRFKSTDKGRFLITGIVLKLSKSVPKPPFYKTLQQYLDEHSITHYDAPTIREAVIAIRSSKLPDWHTIANNGSFFANPIISTSDYEKLKATYPEIVAWEYDGKFKIAAGWLVEKAGFKGVDDEETGMSTWENQALVLVNKHAKSTADLLKFKQKIVVKVAEMFGITLEQEPELLP